ncbi:hypothetical protein BaRGS_00025444 [Batillaria attramentaria]|uniref:Citramalyl-CoA lyase, mitochondrial n=1 Tax=Batillaria attramentaria TaxID=370345 RepID=A0ABD0K873_9CAEN
MQFLKQTSLSVRFLVASKVSGTGIVPLQSRRLLGAPAEVVVGPLLQSGDRPMSTGTWLEGTRPYVPRRSLMYVPGHDMKKLRKIPVLGVDCAVLECEDGVALNKKAEARENIRVALDELGEVEGVDLAVRVNSVSSGLLEEDLRVVMAAKRKPATILLPKTNTVDDIILVGVRIHRSLKAALGSRAMGYCPHLITYVESAEGLMNMKDVLRRAETFSREGVYHLDGVVFGSDDFCADIGAVRTGDAVELTYARQKIVMVAKAYRIQAIDMVYTDYKDLDGLKWQSEQGARKGYTGKQVIHPNQVAPVNTAFTPSPELVERATELTAAFEQHQAGGHGAFTFRGQMVDMPLLLQAKNVLQTMQNIRKPR